MLSWVKREKKRITPICCMHGCSAVSEIPSSFASFDTICTAVNIASDKCAGGGGTDLHFLCAQHYHMVYKYCNPEKAIECSLCGAKCSHQEGH